MLLKTEKWKTTKTITKAHKKNGKKQQQLIAKQKMKFSVCAIDQGATLRLFRPPDTCMQHPTLTRRHTHNYGYTCAINTNAARCIAGT